jgi:hypothetical protein
MSTATLQPATGSRWLDWKPKARILEDSPRVEPTEPTKAPPLLEDSPKSEPTEPSKVPSVGSDGSTSGEVLKIEADPEPAELARAGVLTATEPRAPHPSDVLDSKGVSWEQWRAASLNRLFLERGAMGRPGRITAATIRHGEQRARAAVVRRN